MEGQEIVEAYEQYRAYILKGCHISLSSVYSLEDLWQDVIVDGLVNVPRLFNPEKGASLATYISYRGRWFVKKFIQKRAREPTFIEVMDYHIISKPVSLEDTEILNNILSEMSVRERIIFRGIRDGMSDAEIAKRLDISKQRVFQIVTNVRKRYRYVFPDYDLRSNRNGNHEDC